MNEALKACEQFLEGVCTQPIEELITQSVELLPLVRASLSAQQEQKPVAWARKWYADGEEPKKERNENGRLAWPRKFKFLPLTEVKCFPNDVPLYLAAPQASQPTVIKGRITSWQEGGEEMTSQPVTLTDAIEECAERMWRVHPKDLQDEGITRKQYYRRELIALLAASQPTDAAKENAVAQAQQWAMEAKTQRATVLGILRILGLPENDWEAERLVREYAASQPTDLNSIEQYQLQMAGISTAALGYWKEGDSIHPDYDTPALRDVAKLYVKYAELYEKQSQPSAEAIRREALEEAQAALLEAGYTHAHEVIRALAQAKGETK